VILFWIICIAMLAFALLYVLPPTLRAEPAENEDARREANIAIYRDQLAELEADLRNGLVSEEQYAQDRDDIERNLLADTTIAVPGTMPAAPNVRNRALAFSLVNPLVGLTYFLRKKNTTPAPMTQRGTVVGGAVVLALVAVIFYLTVVGSPESISNAADASAPRSTATTSAPPAERSQAQIEANVAALAKRLQSNPSDAQGWTMLARSYSSLERYGEAAGAYAKLTELTPNDADLWAEYAFAVAMASGRKLDGKPMELIDHALKIDPNNARALGLAANAAFEAKNYQKAIDYWQRLMKQVPAGSEIAKTIQERIDEAKSQQK
jgi:cytochrome c-type biogenesis protein CcmH